MDTLPPPLAKKWGHLPYIKQTTPTSWSSACPKCGEQGHRKGTGEPDRFTMYIGGRSGDPRGQCRRCGYFAWADDEEVSDEEFAEWRKVAERSARDRERERERKLSALQEDRWYEKFCAMTERQRQHWRDAGIPDFLQDYMRLGYVGNKGYNHQGELCFSPALSIPYFDVGWEPLNVQYRLLEPQDPYDKYRFTYGLNAMLYLTDPDRDLTGMALVCEGAKKALVTYLELVLRTDVRDYVVVGVPSKSVSAAQAEQLAGFERVYFLLDPDAGVSPIGDNELAKAVDTVGRDRSYTISLPLKVDDMINEGYLNGRQLLWLIKHARKA